MANLELTSASKTGRNLPWDTMRRRGAVYALALLLVACAFALRSLLAPSLGNQALYLFLVPPVLLAGVAGGWGPGLLATLASDVIHLYATGEYLDLMDPESPAFVAASSRAATFTALGLGIAWFGERLRA